MELMRSLGSPSEDDHLIQPSTYLHALAKVMATPLKDIQHSTAITVLAVITSSTFTASSQPQYTLQLTDPTIIHHESTAVVELCLTTTVNNDINPGDIVYFHNALATTTTANNTRKVCLENKSLSLWNILAISDSVQDMPPLVQYLRKWWILTNKSLSHPASPSVTSPSTAAATPTATTTPAAVSSSKYLRQISQLTGCTFADLYLELLALSPPETDPHGMVLRQRCLMTDYSANPLIPQQHLFSYPLCPANCQIVCDIICPGMINRMPQLLVGGVYKLRNAKVDTFANGGTVVVLARDVKYPNTVLVKAVPEGAVELEMFMERKREMLEIAKNTKNISASETVSASDAAANENIIGITPIAEILTSTKTNTKFRISANITATWPPTPNQTYATICDTHRRKLPCTPSCQSTHMECRFILELRDSSSATCLVMFCAKTSREIARLLNIPTHSVIPSFVRQQVAAVFALQRVELTVASVLFSDDERLKRCLLIADIHR